MLSQVSTTGVLYHATPMSNVLSIEDFGIDPTFHRKGMEASWYVNKAGILWAVAHVSAQHYVSVSEIAVCAVLVEWDKMRRTNRPGFYYTRTLFRIESASPAIMFIEMDK